MKKHRINLSTGEMQNYIKHHGGSVGSNGLYDVCSSVLERNGHARGLASRKRHCFEYAHIIKAINKTAKRAQAEKALKAPRYVGDVKSKAFLQTFEWRRVRMMALKKYGPVCQCCGASPQTGAIMNVDHIKPRNLFPHLALDVNNLQILCHECNHGKGNWDMTDWRDPEMSSDEIASVRFLRGL